MVSHKGETNRRRDQYNAMSWTGPFTVKDVIDSTGGNFNGIRTLADGTIKTLTSSCWWVGDILVCRKYTIRYLRALGQSQQLLLS